MLNKTQPLRERHMLSGHQTLGVDRLTGCRWRSDSAVSPPVLILSDWTGCCQTDSPRPRPQPHRPGALQRAAAQGASCKAFRAMDEIADGCESMTPAPSLLPALFGAAAAVGSDGGGGGSWTRPWALA